MEAIELYTKILEAAKGVDPQEAMVAVDFARRKIEQKMYDSATEARLKSQAMYAGCLSGSSDYADPEMRAAAIVRAIVREKLDRAPGESAQAQSD